MQLTRELLDSYGLRNGNRSRLIGLALELDSRFVSGLQFVRCIADSDFNFIFQRGSRPTHLLYTDYTSVDLYTYEEELLERVLCLGFTHSKEQVALLLDSMTPILLWLFVIRAANERLGWGMTLPPFTRCCSIQGSRITFDGNDFVSRCLDSNGRRGEREIFDKACSELQAVRLNDPRKGIHSDDYFELVGWYLGSERRWRGYSRGKRSVMPVLLSALDPRCLAKEELFVQLNAVFGEQTDSQVNCRP